MGVAEPIKAYVRAHLQDPITASDIAKAAGYSQYHATRLFKAETGVSPFDYIRSQRLIHSAYALRQGKPKVIDVALDFVFDSHEGFTRAFSHAFGITPKKYASFERPEGWLIPYRYLNRQITKSEETDMDENTKVIFTQIVERPARKLILKRAKTATHYFEYCEETGCDVWGKLLSVKSISPEPVCLWLPKKYIKPGTSEYVQGVEVAADHKGNIPDGFDIIELPAAKYLMFQGEPFEEENYCGAIEALWGAIKKYDPKTIGFKWDNDSPRIQLEPRGERGYIEFVAVK